MTDDKLRRALELLDETRVKWESSVRARPIDREYWAEIVVFIKETKAVLADSADVPHITMTKSYLSGRQCCDFTIATDDSETHEPGCPWRIVDTFATDIESFVETAEPNVALEWVSDRIGRLVEEMTCSSIRVPESKLTATSDPPPSTNPDTLLVEPTVVKATKALVHQFNHGNSEGPIIEVGIQWYRDCAKLVKELDAVLAAVQPENTPGGPYGVIFTDISESLERTANQARELRRKFDQAFEKIDALENKNEV